MSKQTSHLYQSVTLPAFEREVAYSPAVSAILQSLLDHRTKGISTLELQQLGHLSVHNHINKLKKDGWLIATESTEVTDTNGKQRKGIALYKVIGCSVRFFEGAWQDV